MGIVSMDMTIKVAEIYNSGMKSIKGIASILNISTSTVNRALKNAKTEGLCNYIPRPKGISQAGDCLIKNKKVKCITTGIIYDSIIDAHFSTKCRRENISECCHNHVSEVKSKDGKILKFEFI